MMSTWVPIPTRWIEDHGLKEFKWEDGGKGSSAAAALMCYMLIAHHTNNLGLARLTYGTITTVAGISRAKISAGLDILLEQDLVSKEADQSVFRLSKLNTTVRGWGMLPAKGLYTSFGRVAFFQRLHLRNRTELDALKLYLLFTARRDTDKNIINLSYDKICEYSGLSRRKIPDALTLLAVNGLIRTERQRSDINDYATSNSYRLSHIDGYRHAGTTGRAQMESGG